MGVRKLEKFAKKSVDTFSICACHPCAGAMLIFSVSNPSIIRRSEERCQGLVWADI